MVLRYDCLQETLSNLCNSNVRLVMIIFCVITFCVLHSGLKVGHYKKNKSDVNFLKICINIP